MKPRKVAVIGTGYVGAITSTCFAWLGHEVVGLESDVTRLRDLSRGVVPFYEPGLDELLGQMVATGRLAFTDQPEAALSDADVIFLCVGTPVGPSGAPDLAQVESAAATLAPFLRNGMVVVNKSTVPVGSGNWVSTLIEEELPKNARPNFSVVSNPEFLREGSALHDFLHPDRVVLGGEADAVGLVADLYQPVLDQSFPSGNPDSRPRLITAELSSAEMIKYAANAFLATKISFANEIANICELVGADARQVLPAIGADHRIGEAFLGPGLGWGGSCFGKDLSALIATGLEYGYGSDLLRSSIQVNELQRSAIMRKLQRELRLIKGRRICLLGLAFKPGTDDLRDAPAVDLAKRLLAAGAVVSAFDPVVSSLPPDLAGVRLCSSVLEAAEAVDAVIVVTEWPEIVHTEPLELRNVMKGDLIVDARNALDDESFGAANLRLVGVGW
ncbi:MAG TPA: UDP-glucose/GDP-mannose dehydrogenase family protein [Actinomycetes bacterium]|nr:UDP-glucose/GDP-mannose dehydrogenase family protein [Actinomycetes bacterium]